MSRQPRPCKVQLCPALALETDGFCAAHRTAKKLAQVNHDDRCTACGREMHVGDYVTRESTATRMAHACCPRDMPRRTRLPVGETPLFDEQEAKSHV